MAAQLPERSFLDLFNLLVAKNRRKCQAKVKKILDRIQKCNPEDPNSQNQGILVSYTLRRSTRGLCSKTDFVREGCTNLLLEVSLSFFLIATKIYTAERERTSGVKKTLFFLFRF
jgi:hypothetical protein